MVAGKPRHVMNYLQDFLFTPQQARTPVKVLSGGERARLLLAKLFATPSNFLVLDEPTNDLDLETLDLLEEVIADYPGTALVVSHDRDFLDRVATSVIAFEGDGKWIEYAGGYSDMVSQRGFGVGGEAPSRKQEREKKRAAAAAAAPVKTKGRLSFKQKHALETIPPRIEAFRAQQALLQRKLDDPNFYKKDPLAFAKATTDYGDLQAKIDKLEQEWLELEMMREELEG
jgi:ATP-binding cassette subfamily F protein uup